MKTFSSTRLAVAGAILLASVWLATYLDTRLRPAPEQAALVDIKDIQTLRAQFNRDAGKSRLIILVSPT